MQNCGQIPRPSCSQQTLFPTNELREFDQTPATAKTTSKVSVRNLSQQFSQFPSITDMKVMQKFFQRAVSS